MNTSEGENGNKIKEITNRFVDEMLSLFVSEVFAIAKVKLQSSEVCAMHK